MNDEFTLFFLDNFTRSFLNRKTPLKPPMQRRYLSLLSPPLTRSFVSDARVKWVKDRALDHVVEREKHLFPFLSLKDHFFNASPSPPHSLPLPAITPLKSSLSLPFRPIQFIRLFPSAFKEESLIGSAQSILQISPSKKLISLHEEEIDVVRIRKDDVADRLLRLLMLSPERKLPLWVIEKLAWDLGLPRDFETTILPNYPDYFCISRSGTDLKQVDLELVCYRKDLAISAMERSAQSDYKKGSPLAFPLHFSKGLQLDKKIQKYIQEFQNLPYISPYGSGPHLSPKSDITEKYTVGVLHEILNLFIGKKTSKNNLILLGEKLKLPPGFRKVILNYSGIFYISNKLRGETVVLREGYKRNLLVEKHALMEMRGKYMHLMHLGKPSGEKKGNKKDKEERESEEREFEDERESEESEDFEEDDFDDEEEEESESDEENSGMNRINVKNNVSNRINLKNNAANRFNVRENFRSRRGERKMRMNKC